MHRDVIIQILKPGDVALLRGLNATFADAFDDPDTYQSAPPSDDYLAHLLSLPHVIAVAATVENDVIGGLVAYELQKFEQPRSEIYIYDLAVADAWRRRGMATAIVDKLREAAEKRGASVIYVQADRDDGPAVALYSKLGTIQDVHHFDIAVGSETQD
ncbi:MAG: AAC(3)-I family aminoglycoside N-acetyltransferase [Pseudomonadota bacterium]